MYNACYQIQAIHPFPVLTGRNVFSCSLTKIQSQVELCKFPKIMVQCLVVAFRERSWSPW